MDHTSELPPPHVLSVQRLAKLTAGGAAPRLVENQIAGMLAAWTTELAEDRSEFADRLNGLQENLTAGVEQVQEALDGIEGTGRSAAERQLASLRTALAAVERAQATLGG